MLIELSTIFNGSTRRSAQGQRHPLPAVLGLLTLAQLAGARSLAAIAAWGRRQPPELVQALGFPQGMTLAFSTLHAIVGTLEVTAFEAALAGWLEQTVGDEPPGVASPDQPVLGLPGARVPGGRLLAAYQPHPLMWGGAGVRPQEEPGGVGGRGP